eukprot:symbB.v1.2.009173.t1/scaffold579.1/size184598/7
MTPRYQTKWGQEVTTLLLQQPRRVPLWMDQSIAAPLWEGNSQAAWFRSTCAHLVPTIPMRSGNHWITTGRCMESLPWRTDTVPPFQKIMMGRMHAVALGSGIEPQWKHDESDVGRMEKGEESIEIITCSEADQREILQERQLINNPVKMCMRSCADQINGVVDDGAATPKKSKRPRQEKTMYQKVAKIVTVLEWLPQMTCQKLRADMVAGLTVGVMVIPQSMSYGAIAGLPYINGMYSACVPTLIYALFGQSRQLAVGPVAMVSLLVEAGLNGQLGPECTVDDKPQYETCPQEYVGLACLTAAMVGMMQILASILKLGFLVTFLGHPAPWKWFKGGRKG